ncbi:DEAD/DEAH box helicase family protein [Gracilibacillus sp. HCP3S3_G5_1]|uniref:DEAD/DEAH box helicase family protein n=1 Tax=unclassified Gracilibacillus TaxID=2625209 RepID=UPI003F8AE2DF
MKRFPKGIQFCYQWRSYQKNVLDNLDYHLKNKHLHLVAPPGSGKTVLGLEVMRRLNKATLIVAPTLAIRNQWADRFTSLFLQQTDRPDWLSTDIRKPAFMTITTYQGLYSLLQQDADNNDPEEIDDVVEEQFSIRDTEKQKAIDTLYGQNFQTVILDEAHHLRTSWWKTAIYFRDQLKDPAVVALTATPPYDVGQAEWQKYIELCGPIDEEIEIASLVKEGDLCPHQDYIWMSQLTKKEKEPIDIFHNEAEEVRISLLQNVSFQKLIESHPWIEADNLMEEKLANYRYFISMIVYLKEVGSEKWFLPFKVIGEKANSLPAFDLEWAEELLTHLLYRDKYVMPKETPLLEIRKQLSGIRAIERRRVKLNATVAMERQLLQSTSKLDSIVEIVQFERNTQKDALRLVVLADYIYKDDLPQSKGSLKPITRLGVIPIFEKLRRENIKNCRLGVLTGSVVIVPKEAVELLHENNLSFVVEELVADDRYVQIHWKGKSSQEMVKVITFIFSKGLINVLIGTTALLGEGWDAPSVNTLILASYVGSFMLTNQMRGRAIRSEPGNKQKVANIWHLVCVDNRAYDGGYDFQSLKRRFRSLNGVDAELAVIQSGIERLRIAAPPLSTHTIMENNIMMKERATNRLSLFNRWKEAVQKGEKKREEVIVDQEALPKPFVFRNTLKSLLVVVLTILISMLQAIGEEGYRTWNELLNSLMIVLMIGIIIATPWWWKALRIFLFNGTIESRMNRVLEVIYMTLYEIGEVKTPISQNKIISEKKEDGSVHCYLEQGSTYEQKLVLSSIQELVDPIENPRYILHRKSGKKFWVRHDYHAVPQEIGRKKEYVEIFFRKWNKKIGKAEMIYTRTPKGRKTLLKARIRAMSSKFIPISKRQSVWK